MIWWYWILFGLALLGAELVTPGGFYILFFGCAALVVGTLVGLGVQVPDWGQWLLFSVLAVASLLLFRGPLLARLKARDSLQPEVDTMVGETAVALEAVAPGAIGKAELRGSAWTVRNTGAQGLAKGQRCRVSRVDGLTLWVTAE